MCLCVIISSLLASISASDMGIANLFVAVVGGGVAVVASTADGLGLVARGRGKWRGTESGAGLVAEEEGEGPSLVFCESV